MNGSEAIDCTGSFSGERITRSLEKITRSLERGHRSASHVPVSRGLHLAAQPAACYYCDTRTRTATGDKPRPDSDRL